jgi:hypothetical protein
MHKQLILAAAMSGCFMQANPGEQSGGGSNLSPDTLNHIPDDVKNAGVPVGRNWSNAGQELADRILAAEQGIVVAEGNLQTVRLEGLKEIAKLDDMGRVQFISGVDVKFRGTDGKMKKTHSNYMTDLRRVSNAVKSVPVAQVVAVLEGKGTYAERIGKIPRASAAGAPQASGTAALDRAAVSELVKEHGADAIRSAVEGAASLAKPAEPISTSQPIKETPQPVEQEQICQAIRFAHENSLVAIGREYAERLKKSTNPEYSNLGLALVDLLDSLDSTGSTDVAEAA